jgi:ABC-2 type transport system permease protein
MARLNYNRSTTHLYLYRKPNPLLFLAEGGDLDRPADYILRPKGQLSAIPPRPRDFKLPDIPKLDWSFIIKTIFSLYVILLGFSGISEEKEKGTLRLVLSNSFSRVRLLTAKYLTILAVTFVPLLVGFVINLVIFAIFPPQTLTVGHLSNIFLMLLLSMAYLSLFAFLSLFFSSLIPRSSLVLLVLLAAWVLFAVIIPDTSGILSQKFSKVPSEYQTAKNLEPFVQKEVWDRIQKIQQRINKGELRTEEEVRKETDQAFEEGQDKMKFYYKSYEDSMKQRTLLAQNLSRLSPASLFQYASEDIAQAGIHREEEFLKDSQNFSRIYDQYILKKVGKLTGVSGWSFGDTLTLNGKKIEIHSPEPEEYRGDMSDFPKFVELGPSLSLVLKHALGDIAGLILWNLALAVLAFAAFLRADVR